MTVSFSDTSVSHECHCNQSPLYLLKQLCVLETIFYMVDLFQAKDIFPMLKPIELRPRALILFIFQRCPVFKRTVHTYTSIHEFSIATSGMFFGKILWTALN